MAVPTGQVFLSHLVAEFGSDGTPTLRDFVRGGPLVPNGPSQNANISTSPAALLLSQFRGAVDEFVINITTNRENLNLKTLFDGTFGAPSAAVMVRCVIASGVVIGGTASNGYALTIGQFPTGSQITVDNNGSIVGAAGAAGTSGVGGLAGHGINATFPNQAMIINNVGAIRGGGGGGGNGGTGGGGSFSTTTNLGSTTGTCPSTQTANQRCVTAYGSGAVCSSGAVNANCGTLSCCGDSDSICQDCYVPGTVPSCTNCTRTTTTNTSGGAGGDGGRGAGYVSGSGVVAATAGLAGALGGTNAGRGGTGGTGGTYATTGATGATGANGNRTNGTAGFAGGGGGYALNKGNNNVTLTGAGTVNGLIV